MRKFIKGILYTVFALGLIILVVYFTPYSYLIKGVYATYLHGESSATIDDKEFFTTDHIRADNPYPWPEHFKENLQPRGKLDSMLHSYETVAFAVFQHDTLIYEEYAPGYGRTSRTNSFSMAKTITSILAEIAIANGDIKGWDQKVVDFLPWLQGEYADDLTLGHLSTMQAGLDWDEHYKNAFGITAQAYYGPNVKKLLEEKVHVVDPPGTGFEYQSGAIQLLGMCVEAATHTTLAELASDWLWTPDGAEDDAEWHMDDENQILAYCCLSSNALDFARIGHILLHNGTWNGKQFMDSTVTADFFKPISCEYYGRTIWLGTANGIDYSYLKGINGQWVIIIPSKEMVIVRLGHHRGPYTGENLVPEIVDLAVVQYAGG